MNTMYDRIKMLRLQNGLTQLEASQKLGYTSPSTISRIEKGEIDLPQSKIQAFADLLGVSVTYLLYGTTEIGKVNPARKVPLIGSIACGKPITAEQNIIDNVVLPSGVHADFALRCKGNSMSPTINNGDIVYIRQQPTVENGQIAAVILYDDAEEAEATLKRVYTKGNVLQLVAENRDYDPIFVTPDESERIIIAGLAVAIHRELR